MMDLKEAIHLDPKETLLSDRGGDYLHALLSEKSFNSPYRLPDVLLDYIRALKTENSSDPVLPRMNSFLADFIPQFSERSSIEWVTISSFAALLKDYGKELGDVIRQELLADTPRPIDPKARCRAIDAVFAAGCNFTCQDIRKADASTLFSAEPRLMITLAAKATDNNFQNVVDLIVENITAGIILPKDAASRYGHVIETAVERGFDNQKIRNISEQIRKAFGEQGLDKLVLFDDTVKCCWSQLEETFVTVADNSTRPAMLNHQSGNPFPPGTTL